MEALRRGARASATKKLQLGGSKLRLGGLARGAMRGDDRAAHEPPSRRLRLGGSARGAMRGRESDRGGLSAELRSDAV